MGLEKIKSQDLADLFWYWRSLHKGTTFPLRKSLEPADISPKLLPGIYIVAVEHDPLQFRFTLTGTQSQKLVNKEVKGDYISAETMGPNFQDAYDSFSNVIETRGPVWGRARFAGVLINGEDLVIEAMFLPLSQTGEQIDYILGANALEVPDNYNHLIEAGFVLSKRWQLELEPTVVDGTTVMPVSRVF